MKTKFIFLLLLLHTIFAFAQESATKEIEDSIGARFYKWMEKSEFETNAEYEKRVNTNAEEELKAITYKIINSIKQNHCLTQGCNCSLSGKYDAENETFLLKVDDYYLKKIIAIKVPRSLAPAFSQNLRYYTNVEDAKRLCNVYIAPQDIIIQNDVWIVSKALILFDFLGLDWRCKYQGNIKIYKENNAYFGICGDNKFKCDNFKLLTKVTEITNTVFYYEWNILDEPNYHPSSSQPISFNVSDFKITLSSLNLQTSQTIQTEKVSSSQEPASR